MSISKRNAEGYSDPTAYGALTAVDHEEKATRKVASYRPLVYIASPFAGDIEANAEIARVYCRFAVSKGTIPLAPHLLYPQFMDDVDPEQRRLGLFFAMVLLGKCEELWVFGEQISCGMAQEIAKVKKRGLPIRYFNENCEEVSINAST